MREIFPTRDAEALCRGRREDEKKERGEKKASNYLQVAFSRGEFKAVGAKRTIGESSNIIHRMDVCVCTYIIYVYIKHDA